MAGAGNAVGSAATNAGSAWVQRPQAQAQVMPQAQPQPAAAQPGNVYQQSAQALGQAQQTAGRLANFQMRPMQAAGMGPVATYGGAQVGQTPAYGGASIERTGAFGGATIAPIERMQAAQLGPVERMQSVGQVADINAPSQIAVDQLRTMDIAQYMNPYTQQVIEAGQQDIERQRQMASNQLGAQAQAARAFGGSRQAVQEGILAGEAARQAGQLSAQQRQAGFQQAIQSGQFDIGQTQAARTLASQQEMQASTLNQQAAEMAAAREQAARAGNMQAANAFAVQQAQFEQQANAANQAAFNARAQAQASLEQQAGLAGSAQEAARAQAQAGLLQQAGLAGSAQEAARASQQAGLTQQAGLSNQAAINAAMMQQAANRQAANQANFGGQFQAAGIQSGAASQLGNLSNLGFGFGQQITAQQAQQGAQQQALQQALIDAAKGQYAGFTGAPAASLGLPIQALGGMPSMGQTTTRQPGLFDYLALGATALGGSDIRLKENVKPAGKLGGVQFYTWDWNEEGKRIANPNQPTFGVMADEVALSHPQHVSRGDDGYLRVHYADLIRELEAA